jgi:hypothetical protein
MQSYAIVCWQNLKSTAIDNTTNVYKRDLPLVSKPSPWLHDWWIRRGKEKCVDDVFLGKALTIQDKRVAEFTWDQRRALQSVIICASESICYLKAWKPIESLVLHLCLHGRMLPRSAVCGDTLRYARSPQRMELLATPRRCVWSCSSWIRSWPRPSPRRVGETLSSLSTLKSELGENIRCFGHWMLWNWIGQLLDSCIREIGRFQIADIRRWFV